MIYTPHVVTSCSAMCSQWRGEGIKRAWGIANSDAMLCCCLGIDIVISHGVVAVHNATRCTQLCKEALVPVLDT